MAYNISRMAGMTRRDLEALSDVDLAEIAAGLLDIQEDDRRQNQLLFYKPASSRAMEVHRSRARVVGVGGGNGSGKSEVVLAELCALATGVFPPCLRDEFKAKFRGPVRVRVVLESLTTTLEPTILPKLQYWKWSGVGEQGSEKGHWGWIPKGCLKDGEWDKAWRDKTRMLTVLCRDPEDYDRVLGESVFQFMCFRGDQRVRMADDTWREIKDVDVGNIVRRPSGGTTIVKNVHAYEDAPLIRVRCRGGRELVVTPNHKHPLTDGRIVETSALRVGDVIRCNRDPIGDTGTSIPDWLNGWAAVGIGDGYIKGKDFSFTQFDGGRVLVDLPPLPPDCRLVKMPSRKGEYRIWTMKGRRDNPLIVALKRWGLWGKGSATKFVPDDIFRQPAAGRAYFLRHLWNTDGTVNGKGRQACYATISRRLAYDVKYLLWGLGIPASVGDVKGKCGFTGKMVASFRVVVSGGSFDRFQAAMKGEDFSAVEIRPHGPTGKITAIEDAGRGPVYCLEVSAPDHLFVVDGLATHNSHDQDPSDFASGDFHHVMMDEPPRLAIFRENEARTMRVKGRLYLAMTWPDDPSIPVDWIYDEIYEKGIKGPQKAKDIDWFELWTTENVNLDQGSVATQMNSWSEETKRVRIYGEPIRFSSRVHPLFTDTPQIWSYPAGRVVVPNDGVCPETGSSDIVTFCHVEELEPSSRWPVIFLLDPHPRKPHMAIWAQIDPNDDIQVIEELEMEADPVELRDRVFHIEESYGLRVAERIMDPNMGRSPASSQRGVTWQDEFASAGLNLTLADDSDVGRGRINEYLRPDPRTLRPRLIIAARCQRTVFQMKRYVWDNFRRQDEKDLKQLPKRKHDDYPTLLKYLMNSSPSFATLHNGAPVIRYGRPMEKRIGRYAA